MKIYKIANFGQDYIKKEKENFINMFGDDVRDFSPSKESKEIKKLPPQQKQFTMMLYRGFNYLPKPNQDGTYTLSLEKSEQKSLWFTHDYTSRHIDPIEYASTHGEYFLTYPLKTIKHYQTIIQNNETTSRIPENILEKSNSLENCRYYMGIELPEGWFFSYKTEKFIVSTVPIVITKDMIKKI